MSIEWCGKNIKVLKLKNIIVVSEFVIPEQNSTGYFWYKTVQKISKKYNITLIAPYHKDITSEHFNSNVFVEYFNPPSYDSDKISSRLIGEFRQTYSFYNKIRNKLVSNNDIKIVSGTNPIFLMFLISILRKFNDFEWHLLVHDIFPQNLVPARILKPHSFIFKILNQISNKVYSQADHIVVIGRDMKQTLRQKGYKKDITVIPNWVDFDEIKIRPKSDSKILEELGWNDDKSVVFQFFGNIGRVQGIDNLLQAIHFVKAPNAKFIFIGNGNGVTLVKEYIRKNDPNNVKIAYFGELPVSKRNLGLNSCDIAIVTLADGMFGLGVPSTAYFSMAADKPILAIMHQEAEVALMVKQHNIGWVDYSMEPRSLARLIDKICENKSLINTVSSREILEQYYNQELLLEKCIEVIGLYDE